MRYLRKYNESNSEVLDEQEIQDFCEMNLAYLMDDGLKVLVSPDYFDLKVIDYKVTLSFRLLANKRWGQIKDHVIPFLTHLRNEYDLVAELGNMKVDYSQKVFLTNNIRVEIIGLESTFDGERYPDWFNIDDIISEKIVPTGRLQDDYKIYIIQFKIKGKKV
jgi:hypothetical protein